MQNRKNTWLLVISLVVYIIGIGASATFNTAVLWANLEGQSFWGHPEALGFDSNLTAEARLGRINCPVILAHGESGIVDVSVRNPQEDPIEAWISAHISMPGMTESMVREIRSVPLEPGESANLRWEVTPENVLNDRVIFVRVFLRLTELHPPARTSHCGISIIDLWGLSSRSITLLALVVGHVFQGLGIWMWWMVRQQAKKKSNYTRNVLIALSILSLVMTVGSLSHSWILAMISLLLSLLIVFTVIGFSLGISDRSPY